MTATGIALLPAIVGRSESGFLYPDVQQQVVGNALLLSILLVALALASESFRQSPRRFTSPPPARSVETSERR